ncbi:MAG: hypothetical protein R3Y47_06250 [Lachnospiraceae bacterium]
MSVIRKYCVFICVIVGCNLLLTGCRQEEALEKQHIEVSGFEENTQLSEYIYLFNESQDEYEVEFTLLEYSEDAFTKLMIDMVGGKGPDLVSWGKIYNKTLTASDVFLDLSAYMDDRIGTKDEYASNILNAFQTSDELKVLVASYKVSSMALLAGDLAKIDNWNIDALMEYYMQREDDTVFFMGETKSQVLAYLLGASLDSFIDWEAQSTSFDSDSFQKLLAFCNEFPSALEFDDSISIRNMYLQGDILMYPLKMSSVFDVTTTKALFGGENVAFMGYPTEDGSALVCEPMDQVFSVNSQCESIEGVYDFLDGILSYEYQSNMESGYPVLNTVLEESLEAAMESTYDSEGNQVVKDQVRFEGEEAENIYQITQSDADELVELLGEVVTSSFTDLELMQIIYEEADAYFHGDKTVEDVTETIKNRADLYIKEKY